MPRDTPRSTKKATNHRKALKSAQTPQTPKTQSAPKKPELGFLGAAFPLTGDDGYVGMLEYPDHHQLYLFVVIELSQVQIV